MRRVFTAIAEGLVLTVAESECLLGAYKCLRLCQVRAGPEMDSAKAGRLDRNERIELLETCVLPDGLVRCRFGDGWISAQTRSGQHISTKIGRIEGDLAHTSQYLP